MRMRASAARDAPDAMTWAIEELARRGADARALEGLLGDADASERATHGKVRAYFYLLRARADAASMEDDGLERARGALEACARSIRCDEDGELFARDGRARRAHAAVCERFICANLFVSATKASPTKGKGRAAADAERANALRAELLPGSESGQRWTKGAAPWTQKDSKDVSDVVEALLEELRSKTTSLMVVQENMATTYYRPTNAPPSTPTRLPGKENLADAPKERTDVGKRTQKRAASKATVKAATPTKAPEVVSPTRRLLGRVTSLISRSPAADSSIKSPAPAARSVTPSKAVAVAEEPEYVSPTRRLLGNVVSFVTRSLSLKRKTVDPLPAATNVTSPNRDPVSSQREHESWPDPEMPEDDVFDDVMPTQVASPPKRKAEMEDERPTKKGPNQPKKSVDAEGPVKRGRGRPKKRPAFDQRDQDSDDEYDQLIMPTQEAPPSPTRGQPKKQRTEEAAPKSKATIEPAAQPAKKRYAVDQERAQETNGEEAPTMPSTPAARAAGSPRIAAPLLAAVKALASPAPAPVIPRAPHFANIRRRVTRFTAEEERALREGVREYGKGSWAQILFAKHSVFSQNNRTQVDLKDKWRNIEMKDKRARENLERDALAAA